MTMVLLALLAAAPAPAPTQAKTPQQGEPVFDPYHAEKSIEIGTFYMKKKNYDAAIERFRDALRYKPGFAKPHRLIGECFEKKGELRLAIDSYGKYLETLPQAEDAEKIHQKISKLEKRLEQLRRRDKRTTPGR